MSNRKTLHEGSAKGEPTVYGISVLGGTLLQVYEPGNPGESTNHFLFASAVPVSEHAISGQLLEMVNKFAVNTRGRDNDRGCQILAVWMTSTGPWCLVKYCETQVLESLAVRWLRITAPEGT